MEALEAYVAKHDECRQQLLEKGSCDANLLIYSVDRKLASGEPGPVGGFADRLKGVLFTYFVARLTGRMFFIDWRTPAPLSEVFAPAGFNWELPIDMANITPKRLDWVDKNFQKKAETPLTVGDVEAVNDVIGAKVALVNCNIIRYDIVKSFPGLHEGLGVDASNPPSIFSSFFSQLFSYKPSSVVSHNYKRYEAFRSRFQALLGVQFRTGGGGAWKDPALDSMENIGSLVGAVDKIRKNKGLESAGVYITTDTQQAKAEISEQLSALGLESFYFEDEPTHLDRSDSERAKSNFHQLVLEHSVLGMCDEVIVGKGAFGVTAAFRFNKQPFKYFNVK